MRMGPDNSNEDPDKIDSLSLEDAVNTIHLPVSDSEDDNDEVIEFGYQLLPQDPFTADQLSFHEDVMPDSSACNCPQDSDISAPEQDAQKQDPVSNIPDRITMNADQIEVIKASMAGFTLPDSSIPAWANAIPEDQWKTQLFSMINRIPGDICRLPFQTEPHAPQESSESIEREA